MTKVVRHIWEAIPFDGCRCLVKNDHLNFEILYVYRGVVRKYRPDFLVRFKSDNLLVLETKGKDTEQDRRKREFLKEWVSAVNTHGGFGHWSSDVSFNPGDIKDILAKHARSKPAAEKAGDESQSISRSASSLS
jgi:type III restriction enzyme